MSVSNVLKMPCGSFAIFDTESSTYGYRCQTCFSIVGSIGEPSHCKEIMNKYDTLRHFGYVWDYDLGKVVKQE